MMVIFSDMVERTIEVFMNDFSVLGKYFDNCLENLKQALIRLGLVMSRAELRTFQARLVNL